MSSYLNICCLDKNNTLRYNRQHYLFFASGIYLSSSASTIKRQQMAFYKKKTAISKIKHWNNQLWASYQNLSGNTRNPVDRLCRCVLRHRAVCMHALESFFGEKSDSNFMAGRTNIIQKLTKSGHEPWIHAKSKPMASHCIHFHEKYF